MDITSIALITGVATSALGGGALTLATVQLRKARQLRKQADDIANAASTAVKASLDMAISSLGGRLAGELAGVTIAGAEPVSTGELVAALKAAGIPTPGCGCSDCDELRLRRAAEQRGGQ